ncbi:MAG: lipopolysaccharide biosynthesis protein [Flavobacteriales bacterium]
MGLVKKDALRTTLISYAGLVLGYLNKALLFIIFLSTVQIGLVNLLTTTGLLFAQLSNLGSIYVTWRFFPFFRNEAKQHYGFLLFNLLIVLFGVVLCTGLYGIFNQEIGAYFQDKSPLFNQYAWWVVPVGVGNVLFMLFENHMRGMFKNILPVFLQDIGLRMITTLLLVMYALKFISFEMFLTLLMLCNLLPALVLMGYLIYHQELRFSFKHITIPKRFRKIILSFSLFSYINTLATMVVVTMDAVMIGGMIGLAATGIYTTMVQVTSAVLIPFRAMTRVSSPIVAKLWKDKDMKGLQEIYQKSSGAGLFIGLFSFLGVWLPVHELFSFLKPEFNAGIPVLFFLLLGRVVDMYCGLNGIIFATSRKYKYDLLFTVFLCAGIYALNRLLIPRYGIAGVGFATGFIFVFYNIARTMYIYWVYQLNPFHWGHLKPLLVFFGVIGIYYLSVYFFPFYSESTTISKLLRIACIEALVLVGFVLPVLRFNLEPETAGYARNFIHTIKKKYLTL